jgi:hypothetical protein
MPELSESDIRRLARVVREFERKESGHGVGESRHFGRSPEVQILRVTGSAAVSGRYPAKVVSYDAATDTDTDLGDCYAIDLAGSVLAAGNYHGRRSGEFGGLPVFTVVSSSPGGITVAELDGSPSYASTTTLIVDQADGYQLSQPSANTVRLDWTNPSPGITVAELDGSPSYANRTGMIFDQADGFVLSEPSAGVVRIDIQDASTTQAGIVNTGAQEFGGIKTFNSYIQIEEIGVATAQEETAGVVFRGPYNGLVGYGGLFGSTDATNLGFQAAGTGVCIAAYSNDQTMPGPGTNGSTASMGCNATGCMFFTNNYDGSVTPDPASPGYLAVSGLHYPFAQLVAHDGSFVYGDTGDYTGGIESLSVRGGWVTAVTAGGGTPPTSGSGPGGGGSIASTALGTQNGAGSPGTITLSAVDVEAGTLLVVCIGWRYGQNQTVSFITLTYDGVSFSSVVREYNNTDDFGGAIFWMYLASATTGDIVLSVKGGSASGTDATDLALVARQVEGLQFNLEDASSSDEGTGTTPDSGNFTTFWANEYLQGLVVTEGPAADTDGTWENSWINGQEDGTASNLKISEGYKIVSTSGAQNAEKSGITSRPWIAIGMGLK